MPQNRLEMTIFLFLDKRDDSLIGMMMFADKVRELSGEVTKKAAFVGGGAAVFGFGRENG